MGFLDFKVRIFIFIFLIFKKKLFRVIVILSEVMGSMFLCVIEFLHIICALCFNLLK
jgi:hypothetical protein